jgi:hypothetical protein
VQLPRVIVPICGSLLVASSAFGAGKAVEDASASEKKEAGEIYQAAMADFDRDDLDTALKRFRESYDLVKSPNSHFMVARTLARMGRNVEAYNELTLVIEEADTLGERYADTATAARSKREETRRRVGLVTVKVTNAPKGTRVKIGEEFVDPKRADKPAPVLPGETKITLVAPDGKEDARVVVIQAGDEKTVEAGFPKPGEEPAAAVVPDHGRYLLDIQVHAAGETLQPEDTTNRGAGVGARAAIELLHGGLIGGVDDAISVGTGADWIGTSTNAHFWIPTSFEWTFWVVPPLGVFAEPGLDVMLGAGTHVTPILRAGARYRVWKKLDVVGRVGIPEATLGASWQL